ncbi:hypothetical protein OK116_07900 [Xylella fastidiosa subsp. fastidiosa]|nr:hypothetical protein [Xylella fastidiosa]WCF15383.1 hypothetical protein OK115_02110 [Xylella fastidiosa subsp. fastidiosa]WCF16654.1 hypothetical protein OK116_07900 [Xylella fastidiosa subsp. fastidiosa]WCF18841.1 hypothetical protein OK118_07705 [Xylella fastidiosa subsp. fastidiosa]WCF25416.1 hypothetical protein OK119_07550 [Xylella fastidiosa subsp. fastidiosa]WDF01605.1 hypothetical protein PUO95_04850 [Xylella fastidiosa subsp. fastidiosa]
MMPTSAALSKHRAGKMVRYSNAERELIPLYTGRAEPGERLG